jgi:hypothetical protein
MWDTVQTTTQHLSHDLPCAVCGHGAHSYLPCDDSCDCPGSPVPGRVSLVA